LRADPARQAPHQRDGRELKQQIGRNESTIAERQPEWQVRPTHQRQILVALVSRTQRREAGRIERQQVGVLPLQHGLAGGEHPVPDVGDARMHEPRDGIDELQSEEQRDRDQQRPPQLRTLARLRRVRAAHHDDREQKQSEQDRRFRGAHPIELLDQHRGEPEQERPAGRLQARQDALGALRHGSSRIDHQSRDPRSRGCLAILLLCMRAARRWEHRDTTRGGNPK